MFLFLLETHRNLEKLAYVEPIKRKCRHLHISVWTGQTGCHWERK